MRKISAQSLNSLFGFLTEQSNTVLWMVSMDYQRQLYLAPSFEKIWGEKTEVLYSNPREWDMFLYENDIQRVTHRIKDRVLSPDEIDKDILYYRMVDKNNNLKFIKSSAYIATNEQKIDLGFIGLSQVISEQQWHTEREKQLILDSDPQEVIKNYFFNILQNELRVNLKTENPIDSSGHLRAKETVTLINNGRPIPLTQRETDCISFLMQGKSAKQTGSIMNISARTVEFHLSNIKEKANCKTKIELLSKIVIQK